jgi:protein PhnA
MSHYICKGSCGSSLDELSVCESEDCTSQWEMMETCECEDGQHGIEAAEEELIVKDANGTVLQNGDSVTLIKDLTLRGSSQVIKVGTKVNNIKLTDDPEEVDCKINGTGIVLRVEFLKKL